MRPLIGKRCRGAALSVFWLWLTAGPAMAADAAVLPSPAIRQLLLDIAPAGSRLVAVGERGRILLSTDEGKNWSQATAPGQATLTAVYFHDDRHGWAVGHDAVILRTEDGGRTWALVHQAPEERKPLLDVWFENPRHGFAIGAYGLALETRDGGRQWRRRTLLPQDMHLNAIVGGPGGRIYIAGEAGTLLRSDDAGRRWRELSSPYPGSFFGVLQLPDGNPLIFGLRGKAFRSPDSGRRWLPVATHGETTLQGGAVLDDGSVVLVGNDGQLLISVDGGRQFTPRRNGPRQAFAAVAASGGAFVLVGERGVAAVPRAESGAR
ncbi:MAG: YCF48-related protein [Sulfuricaulis sp.]|nr:YCF48-related protein [Sulfuricaulis sp.]